MDNFFSLPLIQQTLFAGIAVFLAVLLIFILIFAVFPYRTIGTGVKVGLIMGLVLGAAASASVHYANDKVYELYFKNYLGPKYIKNAQSLGIQLNNDIPVIVNGSFSNNPQVEADALKGFKGLKSLNYDQHKRLFSVVTTCYLHDFINLNVYTSVENPLLTTRDSFRDYRYPLSFVAVEDIISDYQDQLAFAKDKYQRVQSEFDEENQYTSADEDYLDLKREEIRKFERFENYDPKHPICFSGSEMTYIIGD